MADDEKHQSDLPQDEDDNRGATEDHGGNAHPETDPTRTVPDEADEDADERPN
ncbi:MAG: hypothetical protein KJZ53_04965 [Anaerolineales bacterium]|nr:hypothetical protein [Anaerolineales bacterium]QYK50691.1 MAG: hypothetical protein KF701_09875 [Anaerolineales bacterium]